MLTREEVISKLTAIKPYLSEKYSVTELALFGSYSRNEQTEQSDIDVMVDIEKPMGMKFLRLIEDIECLFENEVQVVGKKAIKPGYFKVIQQDLIHV
ncbi:nucleotidyltransferase family protein [soil metagenome]